MLGPIRDCAPGTEQRLSAYRSGNQFEVTTNLRLHIAVTCSTHCVCLTTEELTVFANNMGLKALLGENPGQGKYL